MLVKPAALTKSGATRPESVGVTLATGAGAATMLPFCGALTTGVAGKSVEAEEVGVNVAVEVAAEVSASGSAGASARNAKNKPATSKSPATRNAIERY